MLASCTVHIVCDNVVASLQFEALLRSAGCEPVTHRSGDAIHHAALRLWTGCILIDVRHGQNLQARLRAMGNRLPSIVLGGEGNIRAAVSAMKHGALTFIEKPVDHQVLLSAVNEALADAGLYERSRVELMAADRIASLSRRERQVLDALVGGRPSKIIAFELGISVRTVEVHRARMLHRLRVRKLAEAVRLAVLAGSRQEL
jgi:two-component system, LuxR family, response regulator FixJ